MSTRLSFPASIQVTTADLLPLVLDLTSALQDGETVTVANTEIIDLGSGLAITADAPTTTDTSVTQVIDGSKVGAGHSYRLEWAVGTSFERTLGYGSVLNVIW